tara:strand:- start:193 stop:432 length:240 start_codon:yes stop_codon:yes gene_type:complete
VTGSGPAEVYENNTDDRKERISLPQEQPYTKGNEGSGDINNLRPLTQQTKPKLRGKNVKMRRDSAERKSIESINSKIQP